MLSLLSRVGTRTCRNVSDDCLNNNTRYSDIFLAAVPPWLTGGSLRAVNRVRHSLSQIDGWQLSDTLSSRSADLLQIVTSSLTFQETTDWQTAASVLPPTSTLSDAIDYLEAANNGERQDILIRIVAPTQNSAATPTQAPGIATGVRLMTLHSSKGLSARVVFVPGLEETSLPSSQDMLFPGLLLQSARLLYVGMTRARAGLILSYARSRPQYITTGPRQRRTPSRFLASVGQQFVQKNSGLTQLSPKFA
jgi:superfamily I DNA/RNA helicase